jgi:drug/metabolite transporter (DMT)-like permease
VTVVLALLSSALWGTGDYLGGQGARRMAVLTVLAWVQLSGLALGLVALVVLAPDVNGEGALWGAAAGIVGAAAIGTFYAALAAGAMSLVAPLTACGAVIPALVAIAGGESPSAIVVTGLVLALAGAALVAREPSGGPAVPLSRRALWLAIASAVGIGLLATLLQHASQVDGSSALAAVIFARAAAAPLTVGVILVRRGRLGVDGGLRGAAPLIAAGLFDTSANALFAIATTEGSDAVAAVLGSLYPVMTVILAASLLGERVARAQATGIAVALVGVLLVSAG